MTGAEHAVARQTVNVSVALESEVAACSVFGETQLSVAHLGLFQFDMKEV
jgi:hypothetical protein